jgi:Ca-activated chloride channel family protein
MKDPALLEYAGQGAWQASIFPIPAKGERRIELEYSEVIPAENGLVRYLYPLNTEKFSSQPLQEVRVHLDIHSSSPIRAAYSPSHPVEIIQEGELQLVVGYEETNVKPDVDFSFYYSIGENEAFHLLSYRDAGEEYSASGFFTLLLAPRPEIGTEPLPKDILLVLDRSGSMEGEKFYQAQEALRYILNHLNPDDRFNLISFSTGITTFSRSMQPTSAVSEGLSWVNGLSAAGSTDINRALLEAAAMSDIERPTYLIFLTDGLPTEGVVEAVKILENLERSASDNLRFFAFGVGYDVDTFLLDSLAENHHGSSSYVLPGEQINEVLSGFYAKISSPVLTNLSLDFGEIEVFDQFPSPLPDLFEGSQIVVVGRYREGGVSDVILHGEVEQKTQTFTFKDQIFTVEGQSNEKEVQSFSFIPRLWATRKIGYLLNKIRLEGPEQETIDQIVTLSIRYGIVTPYTSYLVTEPMPLGAAEQERIAEEEFNAMDAARDAPTYGQEAVEKAAGQGELQNSDLASPPQAEETESLRVVGSRTYILSGGGKWIDTAFDPENMETVKVGFLTEDYFALAKLRPNLAAAFALGTHVIAVSEGVFYEVVGEDALVEPVDLPEALEAKSEEDLSQAEDVSQEDQASYEAPEDGSEVESSNQESTATVVDVMPEPQATVRVESTPIDSDNTLIPKNPIPCLGGIFPLGLLACGMIIYRSTRTKRN